MVGFGGSSSSTQLPSLCGWAPAPEAGSRILCEPRLNQPLYLQVLVDPSPLMLLQHHSQGLASRAGGAGLATLPGQCTLWVAGLRVPRLLGDGHRALQPPVRTGVVLQLQQTLSPLNQAIV